MCLKKNKDHNVWYVKKEKQILECRWNIIGCV